MIVQVAPTLAMFHSILKRYLFSVLVCFKFRIVFGLVSDCRSRHRQIKIKRNVSDDKCKYVSKFTSQMYRIRIVQMEYMLNYDGGFLLEFKRRNSTLDRSNDMESYDQFERGDFSM